MLNETIEQMKEKGSEISKKLKNMIDPEGEHFYVLGGTGSGEKYTDLCLKWSQTRMPKERHELPYYQQIERFLSCNQQYNPF